MLACKGTNGTLVMNLSESVAAVDESYAVTTTQEPVGPIARSVFTVQKAYKDRGDGFVRYGEPVRIVSNSSIHTKPLYLQSAQITPQVFARFSRNQEVCITVKCAFQTVWKFMPLAGPASPLMGEPVQSNTELLVEHSGTCELLSNEIIPYTNCFGTEYEVSAKTKSVLNKAQTLDGEGRGTKVRNLAQKPVMGCNIWQCVAATEPTPVTAAAAEAEPTATATEVPAESTTVSKIQM
jgi:hypothetical protein